MEIWVTGSKGSVGSALLSVIEATGTDLDVDVTDLEQVEDAAQEIKPDLIFHLAGAKHAPEGEVDPAETAKVNIQGTQNILSLGVRTILASTCKAADPETVYGASKLIAERMTLNHGGSVARFHNVIETQGNVFELWGRGENKVMPCTRYFIHLPDAVELLMRVRDLPPGRYAWPPTPRYMPDLAAELYPKREFEMVPPRRGDRIKEPLCAQAEAVTHVDGLLKITSPHDPRKP